MQDKTKWEEEFDWNFVDDEDKRFWASKVRVREVKQFIKSLINELKEECVGEERKYAPNKPASYAYFRALKKKRQEIINIFKKYE